MVLWEKVFLQMLKWVHNSEWNYAWDKFAAISNYVAQQS